MMFLLRGTSNDQTLEPDTTLPRMRFFSRQKNWRTSFRWGLKRLCLELSLHGAAYLSKVQRGDKIQSWGSLSSTWSTGTCVSELAMAGPGLTYAQKSPKHARARESSSLPVGLLRFVSDFWTASGFDAAQQQQGSIYW